MPITSVSKSSSPEPASAPCSRVMYLRLTKMLSRTAIPEKSGPASVPSSKTIIISSTTALPNPGQAVTPSAGTAFAFAKRTRFQPVDGLTPGTLLCVPLEHPKKNIVGEPPTSTTTSNRGAPAPQWLPLRMSNPRWVSVIPSARLISAPAAATTDVAPPFESRRPSLASPFASLSPRWWTQSPTTMFVSSGSNANGSALNVGALMEPVAASQLPGPAAPEIRTSTIGPTQDAGKEIISSIFASPSGTLNGTAPVVATTFVPSHVRLARMFATGFVKDPASTRPSTSTRSRPSAPSLASPSDTTHGAPAPLTPRIAPATPVIPSGTPTIALSKIFFGDELDACSSARAPTTTANPTKTTTAANFLMIQPPLFRPARGRTPHVTTAVERTEEEDAVMLLPKRRIHSSPAYSELHGVEPKARKRRGERPARRARIGGTWHCGGNRRGRVSPRCSG